MDNLERAATHDLGGQSRFMCLPVEKDPRPVQLNDFERRCDALRLVLGASGIMTVDELRRGIESLSAEDYNTLSYYEKWLRSIILSLGEKGIIDPDLFLNIE
ncbi:MAG: hypothetical protein B7Y12_14105 [Rhizobiales bacterium 24-66-13]|jgi:hypothetical protein|nr:MAG: hypothetical protein B7Z41_05305 [Rhizobiales bacterium 12-66-7]OYY86968.1 MAG: hypothetical protein B7Y61_05695 [Rhizobiales bacterium 35-66-30]OYZ74963.1 MAG: hypothetical protein B7Y12_14105 [Rhizobiales bacterium 24-66-13]OZB09127.1 MAG: hypothetical protein B7X67_07140 [Rhizobiales bacterium 39-66-18]HQS07818.1 nitrile hydratase subunit beta [Xanthobacteraceae bacterium]